MLILKTKFAERTIFKLNLLYTYNIYRNLVEPVRILDKNSHHRPGSGSRRKLGIRRKVPDAQALDTSRYFAYNSLFVGLAVASERAAVMLAATKTKHVFSPGD
jgi:hypothetical protein